MYQSQSTDRLVPSEQGVARTGYNAIESNAGATNQDANSGGPPTFLSQVKKAKEDSVGFCGFCMAFFALLISSIVWTIVLIVIITVPIVMIVIGAEYFHECPAEKFIPISVIVAGCVAMLSNVINFVDRFKRCSESGIPKSTTVVGWVNLFLNIFLACWFVAMCYWVYSVNPDFKDDKQPNYCNPHLYGFAYWLLNFIFIFFGTLILISGLVMCFAIVCW